MSIIKVMMNFQSEVKLHHWGTSSYAAHVALGALYEGLDPLIDGFAESFMGLNGKGEIQKIDELKLNGPSKVAIESVLNSFESFLNEEVPKATQDTSLLNIRDEMLGLVLKTKYLLTLK